MTDFDPIADSGIVIVDKPQGWASHDVVGKLRRIFRTKKVGHSGTLDPMATGVLVLGIGRGTRFLPHVHADTKSYQATIRLGAATLTDDAEGELLSESSAASVTDEMVREEIAKFTGTIMQKPAAVSAVKIDGVRAYERIRRNVRNGLAVVTVKRDACGGCFIVLPPAEQNAVRNAPADELPQCGDCGSYLVRLV